MGLGSHGKIAKSQEFWLSQSRPMVQKSFHRDFELRDPSLRDKNRWDWQSRPMLIPDQDPVSWTLWSTTLDPIGHTEPSTDTDKRCTFAFFSDYLPGNFGYDKVLMKNDF